jgi:DNA-binding NarL/FixJ family response regulator
MIPILVVVEVPFYRQGLAELLNKSGEVQVVATAHDADSAERMARAHDPAIVLVDVGLADAARAIEAIRMLPSAPKFVALAVSETAVLKWAEHGAAAFVPRSATLEDLLGVLKGVAHDELYCSPRMAAQLVHHVAALASASRRGADEAFGDLSPREHEVLSLLARGMPNKLIARTLAISHATAKNHVHNILEKLHLHSRSQVASLLQGASRRVA